MPSTSAPPDQQTTDNLARKLTDISLDKIEARLEKLERGQAVSQYFFKLLSDQNKDLLKETKSIVRQSQEVMDAIARFDELIKEWDEDHPLIEQAAEFSEYLETMMGKIVNSATAKE